MTDQISARGLLKDFCCDIESWYYFNNASVTTNWPNDQFCIGVEALAVSYTNQIQRAVIKMGHTDPNHYVHYEEAVTDISERVKSLILKKHYLLLEYLRQKKINLR